MLSQSSFIPKVMGSVEERWRGGEESAGRVEWIEERDRSYLWEGYQQERERSWYKTWKKGEKMMAQATFAARFSKLVHDWFSLITTPYPSTTKQLRSEQQSYHLPRDKLPPKELRPTKVKPIGKFLQGRENPRLRLFWLPNYGTNSPLQRELQTHSQSSTVI